MRRALACVAVLVTGAVAVGCGSQSDESGAGHSDLASGAKLYVSDGCQSCHTVDGSPSVGPTFKGLAGRKVKLSGAKTTTADRAYLTKSITDPDAQVVDGYSAGTMANVIGPRDLAHHPDDVRALVAFIEQVG